MADKIRVLLSEDETNESARLPHRSAGIIREKRFT